MKKLICFGDTITEMGLVLDSRGYVARLAEHYIRRADVLARGFSGYTTKDALEILDTAVLQEEPDIVVLFFGANDCVRPDQFQHVPLAEYRANLTSILKQIRSIPAEVLLVTPPPMDERKTKIRTMALSETYAQAAFEAALQLSVPALDLFHLIQQTDDWEGRCLVDGVHLSPHGMQILYEALVSELEDMLPLHDMEQLGLDGF